MKLLQLLQKFCPPPGKSVIRERVEKAALRINLRQEMQQNFTKALRLWNDFFPLLLTESKQVNGSAWQFYTHRVWCLLTMEHRQKLHRGQNKILLKRQMSAGLCLGWGYCEVQYDPGAAKGARLSEQQVHLLGELCPGVSIHVPH